MSYRSHLAAFAAFTTLATAAAPAVALKPRVPPPAPANPETAFAADAFADLSAQDGNVAFSPASIYLALGLLEAGAGEVDAARIAKVLHQSGDAKERDRILGELMKSKLAIADGIFIRKGDKLRASYVRRMQKALKAEIASLDFVRKPEKSRRAINAWIARHTGKKIKELLPAGSIDRDTEVVLANAIYFLGTWADAFDKADTRDEDFHRADGSTVTVPMMHRTGAARFVEAGDATMVELGYAKSNLAMDLILPADGVDLHELEVSLGQRLDGWTGALRDESEVEIAMPRFRVDQKTDLEPMLTNLGLGWMFDSIDLSGMLRGHRDFQVGGAYHQTVVAVDEKGTEAAAATAIVIRETMVRQNPRFVADRPFLWAIRDTKSGAILFMGRTADPSS